MAETVIRSISEACSVRGIVAPTPNRKPVWPGLHSRGAIVGMRGDGARPLLELAIAWTTAVEVDSSILHFAQQWPRTAAAYAEPPAPSSRDERSKSACQRGLA